MKIFDECWPDEFRQYLQDFYQNRKVLVLGADGFLGANCVLFLNKLGADISVVTRRKESRVKSYVNNVLYGDLSSQDFAVNAVKNQDVIFDFMGSTGAVESNNEAYSNFKRECQPHLNLFTACANFNPSVIIAFCSTRLVYGKPQYLPVDEKHPFAPESFYAVHKLTLENYLRVFAKTSGLQSCIFRLSNPYGPNMETKQNTYSVINIFIRQALEKKEIQIYGDGNQYRDYIHVRDVLNAFLAAPAERKCLNHSFNLSGTTKTKLKDAAQIITTTAKGMPLEFVNWPQEHKVIETGSYFASINKLTSYLNLPEQFIFNDALQLTVQDYMKARELT